MKAANEGASKLAISSRRQPRYPRLRSLLAELITATTAQGRKHKNAELAERVGVTRSAVYPWLSGAGRPNPGQIDRIADYFAFGKVDERARIRVRLLGAIDETAERSPALEDPLIRALEGSGPIRVGFVEYDNAGIDRFVRNLLGAFVDFLDIEHQPVKVGFADVTEKLEAGEIDLGCGHWLSPKRLRSLRSISLPIAIGMNGLAYRDAHARLKTLDRSLDAPAILAIMHEGQGPYAVARKVLGLPQARIRGIHYTPEAFVKAYNEAYDNWRADQSGPVPVILTDEVMCRKIYREMIGNHVDRGPPLLLWSKLDDIEFYRKDRYLAANPHYNMAFSVRRDRNTGWYNFIEDSWRIFLRGNIEFSYRLCDDLHRHFEAEVSELAALSPDAEEIWKERCEKWLPTDGELIDLHNVDLWRKIRKAHSAADRADRWGVDGYGHEHS